MQNTQKSMKTMSGHGFTQFEITTNLLRNLHKFNLTPVTKLVLLELTTHLNEDKNGSVVFPSANFIAKILGIGLTATKKAINDLINEGLIIKSKRSKVKGNYNKYLITPKVRNLTSEPSKNECFKKSDSDLFMITNNKEQNKKQKFFKNSFQKNVYIDPERYQTGETKRIEKIMSEDIDQMPQEFFTNFRTKLIKQCS